MSIKLKTKKQEKKQSSQHPLYPFTIENTYHPIEARASSLLRDQSITQSNEKRCLYQKKKKKNKKSTPRYFLKEVNPGTPG